MSIAFFGQTFRFTQPDGSTLQVRGWGDQHQAAFETLDGYTVTQDPDTGFYRLAQLSADGNRLQPVPGAAARSDGGRTAVARCLRVAPYYRARLAKSHYTDPNQPYGQRAQELIREALAFHKGQGLDFSRLTPDGQGFVYAMNIFCAGPNVNNWSQGLWPHASALNSTVTLAAGRVARDYQFTHMGTELELGTFCHENGHMLCDYPDLYDYGGQSGGIGYFCLMCAGNNANPKNPVGISAYLKRLSGWAGPVTTLEHGKTVTLAASGNQMAMLAKNDGEYFLIENRQQTGRDAALPDAGLAIWHADEGGSNNEEAMTAAKHYELSLKQADGLFELERSNQELGDANDLYVGAAARFGDDTTPASRWWDGTSSFLVLDQFTASGAAMGFRCNFANVVTPPSGGAIKRESAPNRAIPDNNSNGINDTLHVADAFPLAELKVGVAIAHTWRGDLEVRLLAPWGEVLVLHPKGSGGDADDLRQVYDAVNTPALATWRGRPALGAWRLEVRDLAGSDVGRLERWWLEMVPAGPAPGMVELEESPGMAIPDSPAKGIERILVATLAGVVARVEVELDILHSYIGDLRVVLVSPAGAAITLHERTGAQDDNIAATYTVATTPALAGLAGQPIAGTWRLRLSDHEAHDVGKLRRWKLTLRS